ncbi:trypsin-like peptidase domain-containing protein [Albimonas sp. CAU 1670]|uniref:trypsin-like peptidase domain-containing protein n=1 Tax=Albimonas sp. CAU 1670 TaxID=3032599 RepID=UPI0023DAEB77|nr:trypsin-like peptidase domain-containing protein [Albimonas sp. CAU 1670]MDF2234360.1 trypsin-like peptidase domain-containing protein [Albimonas sp. CAU 1670]
MPFVRPVLVPALALALVLAAPPGRAQTTGSEAKVPETTAEIQLSFAPVVKAAAPSVVNIYAKRVVERPGGLAGPFAQDPFFRRFFQGMGRPTQQVQNSLGSGVIVREDGLVVTNLHVVGQATEIRAVLTDGREFEAEILLADKDSDLVVLKLQEAEGLPALPLRDTAEVEVGDLVLAIGNPFGVGQTVTSGIVSALARTREAPTGGSGYYLQTDAAINPGNSGGALVDMRGRLLGINTAILSRSGGSIGIGFAVPSDLVAQVVAQAEAGRSTLTRPWAGLSGQPVDGALAEALGLDRVQGLAVSELHPLSPFARAGLARGDVLLSVDGRPVSAETELEFRLATLGVGREAEIAWISNGEERRATLRLTAAPDEPARDERELPGPSPLGGLTISNLNPAVAMETGLPDDALGVVVLDVAEESARAGFRKGDRILEINGAEIADTEALDAIAAKPPRVLELTVERAGRRGKMRFSR